MKPQILRPPKKRILMLLASSLLLTVGGIWARHEASIMWLPIISFGSCSIIFLISLLPHASYLRLEDEEFTFVTLFRSYMLKWHEVVAFYPGKIGRQSMVFYDLSSPTAPHAKMRRANVALCGHEAALPYTYGLTAEHLAEIMNDLKNLNENRAYKAPEPTALDVTPPAAQEPRLP